MNLDYIAGFFDGEGFASLLVVIPNELHGHHAYVTPRIGFSQSKERSEVPATAHQSRLRFPALEIAFLQMEGADKWLGFRPSLVRKKKTGC